VGINADLAGVLETMRDNRAKLLATVESLSPADMDRARPGGWSIGRVLHHIIESEAAYVKLVAHLRGAPAPDVPAAAMPNGGADAASQLAQTRTALLSMAEGVDDDTLYRLVGAGTNEYSVLSVLENDADHDHEHLAQITRLAQP
jgi:hypothetical protein